jgi:hypothetical protein
MNDDYLWDKSGQPDPEIQQLEEILGTLRYRPRPLEIPSGLPVTKRRSYFPLLAIAATVLVALLAGVVWLRVRTNNLPQQYQAQTPTVSPIEQKEVPTNNDVVTVKTPEPSPNNIAVNNKPRNRSSLTPLRKRERQEAVAAKEQVMLALRLASEKLNLAHRKTQASPANQIKNQHRIG